MDNIVQLVNTSQDQGFDPSAETVTIDAAEAFGDMNAEMPEPREDEMHRHEGLQAEQGLNMPSQDEINTPDGDMIRHKDPWRGEVVMIPAAEDRAGEPYVWAFYEPKFKSDGTWMGRRGNGGKKMRQEYLEWLEEQRRSQGPALNLPDENGEMLSEGEKAARLEQAEFDARIATAEAIVQGSFMMAEMWISEEWAPEEGEVERVTNALVPCMEGYDIKWGPKMNLFMVVTSVAAKRRNKPKTKHKLGQFLSWTKVKLHGFWWYIRGKKANKVQEQEQQASEQG